jgi:hypothetical protein
MHFMNFNTYMALRRNPLLLRVAVLPERKQTTFVNSSAGTVHLGGHAVPCPWFEQEYKYNIAKNYSTNVSNSKSNVQRVLLKLIQKFLYI